MKKGASFPERMTVEDWLGVEHDNEVARQMEMARFKLADLGNAGGVGLRAFYISGPPGIGKTFSIAEQEQRWKARGIEARRFRPKNVFDLLDQYQAAAGKCPLIMEEADVIFRSKAMFEILKQATDPITPDIIYRMQKIEGEKVSVPISLNVPLIVSTNMDLLGDDGWHRDLLADRDALFNRSMPIVIADDPWALWEWSVYLALRSHLTLTVTLRNPAGGRPLEQANPLQVQARAIAWFTENLNNLAVVSPRTLKHVAQAMGRANRGDMPAAILEQELKGLLGPARKQAVPVPKQADWSALLKSMPKQGQGTLQAA